MPKKSKKETPTEKDVAGLIKPRPNADEEWNKLKSFVGGDRPKELTELEKRLLTNDSEDLNLDPMDPEYPPT